MKILSFRFVLSAAVLVGLLGFGFTLLPNRAYALNTIVTSQYLDNDGNGTVDRIRWTMDENVTTCTYEAGDWTVNTAGSITAAVTGLSCTGANAILDILVSADANETGGVTNPVISYANVGTLNSVALASGAMTAKASVTATDAALPIALSRTYQDNGTNGSADRLVLTFSETVTQNGLDLTQFAIVANNLTGFTTASAIAGSGTATLTLTVGATANLTGVSGGTEPTVQYTQSITAANRVKDSATTPNDMASQGAASAITDGATPVLISGKYQDTNNNGQFDTISLTWTENIATNTALIAEFAYVANDITGSVLTGGVVAGTGSPTITLTLGTVGAANITSHTTAPTLAYTDAGGTLLDAASNQAVNFTATNLADGAAPVFVSATTTSTTNVRITMSESLTTVTFGAAAAWTATGFTSSAAAIDGTDNKKINLTVSTIANGFTASDFAFSTASGGVIQDAIPNTTVSFSAKTIGDSQAPTVTITSTSSNPTSTSPISMTATFSEVVTGFVVGDISVSNGSAGSFSGSGATYTFNVTPTNSGTVTVDIGAGVAQDGSGNNNLVASQFSITYSQPKRSSGSYLKAQAYQPPQPPVAPIETPTPTPTTEVPPSEPISEAPAAAVEVVSFTILLVSGSTGDDVKNLQQVLANQGFNPGSADGIFGQKTCEAVKAFQAAHDLVADCKVGQKTQAALNSLGVVAPSLPVAAEAAELFTQFLTIGARGDEVINLQQVLANQGFNPGSADGIFGQKTCEAVKAFQAAHDLVADCKVGQKTQAVLNTLL